MKQAVYLLLITAIAGSVFAEQQAPRRPTSTLSAGAGLLITDKPHKGGDTEIRPIPLIFYRVDRLVFTGLQFSYYFIYEEDMSLSLIGAPRFEGYDDDESRTLNGMHDRDGTYELGVDLSKSFDWGTVSLTALTDVLGEHSGQEVQLQYERKLNNVLDVPSLDITPSIGINWRSKQLNDYYYGVEGTEATPARPEYHAGSTVGVLAGLRLDYPVDEQWSLFSSFNIEWLGSEITDSPIVNEHTMTSFILGAMYRF